MSRTRRFLGGLVFGYANQALITLVGLWLTAFLLGRLGQEDYGLWLVAMQILGYLMLLDLGVVALLPRDVACATGRAGGTAQATDLAEIVGRTVHLVMWQLPLIAAAALAIWFFLPAEWQPLHGPIAIVMGIFVATFPLRIFHALLSGLQELAFIGGVHTAAWVAGTATIITLVLADIGLYALAVGWGVNQVVSALLWWIRIRKRYASALPTALSALRGAALRERLTRSGWVSVGQLAQVFLYGTELLIIGKLLGPEAVVPYFCTAKVLTVLGHQAQMFAQTAGPGLSELRAEDSREKLVRACSALTQGTVLLSGLIVCVVLLVNEGFVAWWVGPERFAGTSLTVLLLIGMLLRHWNMTAVYSLFAFARDRRIALTTLIDGVLTIGVTIVLVDRFGLIGAAVGTLFGVVLVSLPLNLMALSRELRASPWNLVATMWPWFWRFALAAGAAHAMASVWTPDTFLLLVAETLGAAALYGAIMFPLALRGPVGVYVRPRLQRLVSLFRPAMESPRP